MREYPKIQTLFKRDMDAPGKPIIEGDWTLPEFEYLKDAQWIFTEKVDGMNIRVMFRDGAVTFGGKTDNASIPAKLVERLYERFPADKMAAAFDGDVCLYGEGYGAKIQKGGGNYRPDQDFVLFDVKVGDWWLRREDVEDVAAKLGIDVVPVVGTGTLWDAVGIVRRGLLSQWGAFGAEGLVVRPAVDLLRRNGERIIGKIKARDFAR